MYIEYVHLFMLMLQFINLFYFFSRTHIVTIQAHNISTHKNTIVSMPSIFNGTYMMNREFVDGNIVWSVVHNVLCTMLSSQ